MVVGCRFQPFFQADEKLLASIQVEERDFYWAEADVLLTVHRGEIESRLTLSLHRSPQHEARSGAWVTALVLLFGWRENCEEVTR